MIALVDEFETVPVVDEFVDVVDNCREDVAVVDVIVIVEVEADGIGRIVVVVVVTDCAVTVSRAGVIGTHTLTRAMQVHIGGAIEQFCSQDARTVRLVFFWRRLASPDNSNRSRLAMNCDDGQSNENEKLVFAWRS